MKLLFALGTPGLSAQVQNMPEDWVPANPQFRGFYGWDDSLGTWEFRRTDSGLSYHVFTPVAVPAQGVKGTLFLIHGYLEHGGTQVHLARIALKEGWIAVALDLPGHGLSPGTRASIQDFGEYAKAVGDLIAAEPWPGNLAAAGHSTGCAALMESRRRGLHNLEKVWFTAPLVRTWLWGPSMVIHPVISTVVPVLPARMGATSRDAAFNALLEKDPLTTKQVPKDWVTALNRWEKTTLAWEPLPWALTILQGTADTVVDGTYNVPFLLEKYPGSRSVILEGALHDPPHDEEATATKSRDLFREWLRS